MQVARALFVESGGAESRATTFARDQLAALRCADERAARARIWHREARGLLLGRHHRIDVSSPSSAGLSRRLSGGRIVPVGPGVTCITLFVPLVDWLDPKTPGIKPQQVLNRALRPLLALLRERGVDAFYGGRDLVTVERRTISRRCSTRSIRTGSRASTGRRSTARSRWPSSKGRAQALRWPPGGRQIHRVHERPLRSTGPARGRRRQGRRSHARRAASIRASMAPPA
jgi:hypothetical protein